MEAIIIKEGSQLSIEHFFINKIVLWFIIKLSLLLLSQKNRDKASNSSHYVRHKDKHLLFVRYLKGQ